VSSAGIEPPPWSGRLRRLARKILQARRIDGWELSVMLCDDATIQALNRRYRGLDSPTDVLAFSQAEGETLAPFVPAGSSCRPAGDVVISLETGRRNAAAAGVPEEEELKRLLIHGILHLEGLEHPREDGQMLAIQERMVESLRAERVF
jgi:probable rRNA maturation factor